MPFQLPLGADQFAQGVIRYFAHYSSDTSNQRIVIPVTFGTGENAFTVDAIVDTGGWCILHPAYAQFLDSDIVEIKELRISRGKFRGGLYRIPAVIEAEEGGDVSLEATVFIPQLASGEIWSLPNFLGLEGFLERIRFAIDPETNRFYFGGLGSDLL